MPEYSTVTTAVKQLWHEGKHLPLWFCGCLPSLSGGPEGLRKWAGLLISLAGLALTLMDFPRPSKLTVAFLVPVCIFCGSGGVPEKHLGCLLRQQDSSARRQAWLLHVWGCVDMCCVAFSQLTWLWGNEVQGTCQFCSRPTPQTRWPLPGCNVFF